MKHVANCLFLGLALATAFVAGVLCGRGESDCIPLALVICGAFVIGLAINNYPIGVRTTPLTERRWEPGGKP